MDALKLLIPIYILMLISSADLRAEKSGPESPMNLLPPIGADTRSSKQDDFRARPSFTQAEPLLDLEDPSTLLDTDDIPTKASPPAQKTKNIVAAPNAPTKNTTTTTTTTTTTATAATTEPPKTDKIELKMGLLPQLPMLKTAAPAAPAAVAIAAAPPTPPMPPLMAAMNPPPAPVAEKKPEDREVAQLLDLNLGPMMGGLALPSVREPMAEPPPAETSPTEVTKKFSVPNSTPMFPLPGVPDIAIILAHNQFFPSRIRLKEGIQTRLIFTTVNKKPAALVIERLQIQRWIAKEKDPTPTSELERSKWEVNKEISSTKITEITLEPKKGTYAFHDAISGAAGEITVE